MKANATCFLEFKMLWCWDPDRVHLLSFSPPIPSVFADRLQCLWQEQPTLLLFCKDDKRTNLLWGKTGNICHITTCGSWKNVLCLDVSTTF